MAVILKSDGVTVVEAADAFTTNDPCEQIGVEVAAQVSFSLPAARQVGCS